MHVMAAGDWFGVPTEVWTGFGGTLLGGALTAWVTFQSAKQERLLNRVTRLVELYQEHGHRVVDVEVLYGQVYDAQNEHEAAEREGRPSRLAPPLALMPQLESTLKQYRSTFRLIAANETDPTRTVALRALAKHLIGEGNFIRQHQYAEAKHENLKRRQYHTHLQNSVLEMMHHLPLIPRLGWRGKLRRWKARRKSAAEGKRLDEFTTRVVDERIESDRKAAATQANKGGE
ncbi:MAG: hypothetical protein KAI24_24765 [Planctomycetes bacterium]|nr:hypothetical protein [Planctomycetota bacterium]